jgi:hypothetical protein
VEDAKEGRRTRRRAKERDSSAASKKERARCFLRTLAVLILCTKGQKSLSPIASVGIVSFAPERVGEILSSGSHSSAADASRCLVVCNDVVGAYRWATRASE